MNGRMEEDLIIEKNIDKKIIDAPEFVQEWISNLRASKITAKSQLDYCRKVIRMLEYINSDISKITIKDISRSKVQNYYTSIQRKEKDGIITETSTSYQQSVWFALNNFLGYMKKINYLPDNYMEDIKKPKTRKDETLISKKVNLSSRQLQKIINNINDNTNPLEIRDKAILLIYMSTGMRRAALTHLNIDDVDLENKKLVVKGEKGQSSFIYNLNDPTIKSIKDWLAVRSNFIIDNNTALFLSIKGNRIRGNTIYKMVDNRCSKVIGTHIHPHTLRAAYVSILYNKTKDIDFVRKSVGHSNIATTQKYIVTDNKEREIASTIMGNIFV